MWIRGKWVLNENKDTDTDMDQDLTSGIRMCRVFADGAIYYRQLTEWMATDRWDINGAIKSLSANKHRPKYLINMQASDSHFNTWYHHPQMSHPVQSIEFIDRDVELKEHKETRLSSEQQKKKKQQENQKKLIWLEIIKRKTTESGNENDNGKNCQRDPSLYLK